MVNVIIAVNYYSLEFLFNLILANKITNTLNTIKFFNYNTFFNYLEVTLLTVPNYQN